MVHHSYILGYLYVFIYCIFLMLKISNSITYENRLSNSLITNCREYLIKDYEEAVRKQALLIARQQVV